MEKHTHTHKYDFITFHSLSLRNRKLVGKQNENNNYKMHTLFDFATIQIAFMIFSFNCESLWAKGLCLVIENEIMKDFRLYILKVGNTTQSKRKIVHVSCSYVHSCLSFFLDLFEQTKYNLKVCACEYCNLIL